MLKFLPGWTNGAFPDLPFMDRMTIVFIFLMLLMVVMSLLDKRSRDNPRVIEVDTKMFRTSPGFIIGSVLIVGILAALYTIFY
ncbi:MAG: hypothetical protein EOO68_11400 [Moraxellaceae bacterium]|nr:MAG: hypothetical protein EOO68_11400 [Moraxellaceae bacterium]